MHNRTAEIIAYFIIVGLFIGGMIWIGDVKDDRQERRQDDDSFFAGACWGMNGEVEEGVVCVKDGEVILLRSAIE